jgi:hypothetical protein
MFVSLLIPLLGIALLLMTKPRPTPDPADLLDRTEAARFLRQAVSTLDRYTWAGRIPHYRLPNGRTMYDPKDLSALVASGYRPASSDD